MVSVGTRTTCQVCNKQFSNILLHLKKSSSCDEEYPLAAKQRLIKSCNAEIKRKKKLRKKKINAKAYIAKKSQNISESMVGELSGSSDPYESGQTSKTKPLMCKGCLYVDYSIGRLLGHLEKSPECKAKYPLEAIEDMEKSKMFKRKVKKSNYYKKMKRLKTAKVNYI